MLKSLFKSLILIFLLTVEFLAQSPSLEYIFQDTQIVNPRPSLKYINTKSNKIYYYADDDYNGSLSLFYYNYSTGESYRFPDSLDTPSEFRILANGDALIVDKGNLYISKDFVNSNTFTKDIQLTNSDDYLYSPEVIGDYVIFRKKGNYFITSLHGDYHKVTQLTVDESDSFSYQMLGISNYKTGDKHFRLLFARYDNSTKKTINFPDYMGEFVIIDKQKKGISTVKLREYDLNYAAEKDSLLFSTFEIIYPKSIRYSTQYAAYSADDNNLILDVETLDRHTRKIFDYNFPAKSIKEIYSESDTAWYERHDNATRVLEDNKIIFESESSGYNNLYTINIDGSNLQPVISGNYTITESLVDNKNNKIYFSANIDKPTEYNIYSVNLSGGEPKKLTSQKGDYSELEISSDGNYLFYKYSYITKPGELYYYGLNSAKETQITNTISPKFSSIDWNIPEEMTFNSEEDGALIHAFVYKPANFNPRHKYPVICFVHGAGYLQNVTWGFSQYYDNFEYNTFLTNNGYIVFDIDFRGSMGYGKEFRNKTYRNLGYWEVSDYISGIDFLNNKGYIDRDKVGIYGGSYGGFITQMALFLHPEYFKAGVSLRGVSDWKNYFYSNPWFILPRLGDLNDAENRYYYEVSSPITYAENLSVPLLITHGMLDDNVFFQQSVQLIQKLIENRKDFDVMIYPKELHSFHIQSSWLDQYKRIYKFFEEHIK